MATLFERLDRGRPSPEAAKPKRQLKNTDLVAQWVKDTKIKTFLMDALAKGPVSATTIQKRGTEQGFTRKQLWRAKGLVGVISFKKGRGYEGRWFWTLSQNPPSTINPKRRLTRRLRNLSKALGFRLQPIGKSANKAGPARQKTPKKNSSSERPCWS
jgi:hypothetical protein